MMVEMCLDYGQKYQPSGHVAAMVQEFQLIWQTAIGVAETFVK
jgi:hypothetical protein